MWSAVRLHDPFEYKYSGGFRLGLSFEFDPETKAYYCTVSHPFPVRPWRLLRSVPRTHARKSTYFKPPMQIDDVAQHLIFSLRKARVRIRGFRYRAHVVECVAVAFTDARRRGFFLSV